jgi:tRNA U34 5-methylaminomethyl-2-thiouridine-forming methyltransferase MnmC
MSEWIPKLTSDGSFTFFSERFREAFHSYKDGARQEAVEKFVVATDLCDRALGSCVVILDVCYGLGYNSAAAIEAVLAVNPDCRIELYGLELDPTVPLGAIVPQLLEIWPTAVQEVLIGLAEKQRFRSGNINATLLIGDARLRVQELAGIKADVIFFDPFSPKHCPELWTVEFCAMVAGLLGPGGKLSTYSRSAAVRTAFLLAGLRLGTIPLGRASESAHEWSQGTVAAWEDGGLVPLLPIELEHLQTRAAVPYRDPSLGDESGVILARREEEQRSSGLEASGSWRRRWKIV